jgi:hypothetical protein
VATRRELETYLDSWTGAGLITVDQAGAIRAHEADDGARELPRWVEPVAYLGAALVAIALLLFVVQVWDRLAMWSQVGLAAVVTLTLLLAGGALNRSDAAPARRAASFAWLLAVVGVGATAALVFFEFLDVDENTAILLTAACVAGAAGALYLAARRALQQVALAAGVVFLTVAAGVVLTLEEPWVVSVTFLALGAIWLLLTWGGVLQPAGTGWVLGGLLALAVGSGGEPLWAGIGVAVGLGLVVLSAVFEQRALLVIGVLGLLVWIPTTVITLFEGTVAVPVAILVTGVVTLTVVVAAVRHGRRSGSENEAEAAELEDDPDTLQAASRREVSVDA